MAEENQKVSMSYYGGGSDKVYHAYLVEDSPGRWRVYGEYGRRGAPLQTATKVAASPYGLAAKAFNKLIAEKTGKGYKIDSTTIPGSSIAPKTPPKAKVVVMELMLLNSITESQAADLLKSDYYVMEEKYDGERRAVVITPEGIVHGLNRKGEVVALHQGILDDIALMTHESDTILDGELIGNYLRVFDIMRRNGHDMTALSYDARRKELDFLTYYNFEYIFLVESFGDETSKSLAFERLQREGREGVVFKERMMKYQHGRPSSGGHALKYKFYSTASVIVNKVNAKRSFEMKVLDDINGYKGVVVGNVTVPPGVIIPDVGDIIEVRYLYAYKGGSLYQPTYIHSRHDITHEDCVISQLKYKPEAE